MLLFFFFFNDTATTEIYTLSLHDALPISLETARPQHRRGPDRARGVDARLAHDGAEPDRGPAGHGRSRPRGPLRRRSEEHTSELQSLRQLVCRLLLEKKKNCSRLVLTTDC